MNRWRTSSLRWSLILGLGSLAPAIPALGSESSGTKLGAGPAPESTETPVAAPGTTKELAIEVCQPEGEEAYLRRLRCPNGEVPRFDRSGSVGPRHPTQTAADCSEALRQSLDFGALEPGVVDFHTIDLYQLDCPDKTSTIYLDMYHCPPPSAEVAPPGFELLEKPAAPE